MLQSGEEWVPPSLSSVSLTYTYTALVLPSPTFVRSAKKQVDLLRGREEEEGKGLPSSSFRCWGI